MPYPDPPTLPTLPQPWRLRPGLLLRRPTIADATAITAAVQPFEIRRNTLMPDPYDREDAEHWAEQAGRGEELAFLIVDEDDRVLGGTGLMINWREWSAEVGYWLATEARGRGLVSDAVRALCRLAFDEIGLGRVQLRAAVTNAGSNAVAERLGFVREGTLRSAHLDGGSGVPTEPRVDMHVWGLLPGELR